MEVFDRKKFGYAVLTRRTSTGLGVRGFAKIVGVSPASLSRIENGRVATLEAVLRICRSLGFNFTGFIKP